MIDITTHAYPIAHLTHAVTVSSASWFNAIGDFSRNNCVGICAFLVPANMIATTQTMVFTGIDIVSRRLRLMMIAAIAYSMIMVLHVFTWFSVGVVAAPTFILLFLGTVCLAINLWAIAKPQVMAKLLRIGYFWVIDRFKPMTGKPKQSYLGECR
ncbi:hypothetical protein Pse7367_1518 [Thalassoporum mexicanum PCC 7367]|uniref:hypothetical protein n=1 Tax=Thalassoporum mexicanum TaxID=3457544 RepID=UPI00029FFB4B|nr:hypothetical protein [Pseudanabaena sp. PCC 7367]AFY69807.1 hypothetical protein Pse7367_1518 [Pseudanabaena sp. PCC 7367]